MIDGHSDIEQICFGDIDLDSVIEEASIGNINLPKLGERKIYVYSNEGPIPHFHIIDKQTNGKRFNCCICIYEAKYFNHGYKTDRLTNAQLKVLDKWLRQTAYTRIGVETTRWGMITFGWEDAQGTIDIYTSKPKNIPEQPDYTQCNSNR